MMEIKLNFESKKGLENFMDDVLLQPDKMKQYSIGSFSPQDKESTKIVAENMEEAEDE